MEDYNLGTGMLIITIQVNENSPAVIDLGGVPPLVAEKIFVHAAELLDDIYARPVIKDMGETIAEEDFTIIFDDPDDDPFS